MSPRRPLLIRLALMGVVVLLIAGTTLVAARTVPEPLVEARLAADDLPDKTPADAADTVPVAVPVAEGQTGVAVPVATTAPIEDAAPFAVLPTYRAAVAVEVTAADEAAGRALLATLDGVAHVAGVTLTTTSLGGVPAAIAEVQPEEFRPFTPDATANHQPLWERIEAGDIAVTHEFGTVHEVPLGSRLATGLTLPTGDPVAFRVGALATNGTPPLADAIVVEGTLAGDGGREDVRRRLLVGLDPAASPVATVDALADAGFTAEEIPDPRLPQTDVVIPAGGITPENVWDHLALCESSGDWHINTGNGYYGGVQFLPESWAAVGGQGLPHESTKEEQIYRATLLWQIQGWNAWPQCARKLGLIVDPPPEPTETPQPVRTEPPQ